MATGHVDRIERGEGMTKAPKTCDRCGSEIKRRGTNAKTCIKCKKNGEKELRKKKVDSWEQRYCDDCGDPIKKEGHYTIRKYCKKCSKMREKERFSKLVGYWNAMEATWAEQASRKREERARSRANLASMMRERIGTGWFKPNDVGRMLGKDMRGQKLLNMVKDGLLDVQVTEMQNGEKKRKYKLREMPVKVIP